MKLYPLITVKRKLEEILMSPFVWWGKRWARKHPLPEEYDLFFFFPIYGLGGAEKVNADVVGCFPDKKSIIFFTRTSKSKATLHLFLSSGAEYRDISPWTDNKKKYWDNFFYRGVCAEYINSQSRQPVVINGQCNFAYKLLPHLRPDIHNIEIIHNSEKKFAWVTFPYVPFIKERVMVTNVHIADHGRYYDELGIPAQLKSRMHKVLYKADIPQGAGPRKQYGPRIQFYYAGRGGYQKRLWLLLEGIRKCSALNLPADFHLAGNFREELPADYNEFCTYHGEINGGAAMAAFHARMDVLLMTSAFEGFPMVIMEAMTHGVVPVATAVDGVPENIGHLHNGMLIENRDEATVVNQLVEHVAFLCNHRQVLQQLSEGAFNYAQEHFSAREFCKNYRRLVLQ